MDLRLDYQKIRNSQQEMETCRMQFETAFRHIVDALMSLTAHGYVTEDSRELLRKLQAYEDDFQGAVSIMAEYAEMLEIIGAAFRRTESELSEQARQIHAN